MTRSVDPKKLLIGAHTSAAGGVQNAIYEAASIGATTCQLFTRNQKQWHHKPMSEEEIARFTEALEKTGLQKIMSHAGYLINLGSPKPDLLKKSRTAFKEELIRCQDLGITYLNFHPGAATGSSPEECLDTIVESLLELEKQAAVGETTLLLESTAGQGTCVGYLFEHLGYIISKVHKKIPIGVCIDTCHSFTAGYDIRTKKGWEETLKTFDKEVGLKYLTALHVNDSKQPLGSRKDRHEHLGKGEIGIECFKVMMTHPKLQTLPKYLETPLGPSVWKEEIQMLREFACNA